MGLPWDAYYVLTKAESRLTNSKVHPNSGSPNYNIKHTLDDAYDGSPSLAKIINVDDGSLNLYLSGIHGFTIRYGAPNIIFNIDGATGKTSSYDWHPILDNNSDFGTPTRRWKNGYFAGILYQGAAGSETFKLSSAGAIDAVKTIAPFSTNAYDLGTASVLWKDLYLVGDITDGTDALTVAELGDSYRHITATGDSHSYIDQNVTTTGTPTFATVNTGGLTLNGDLDMNSNEIVDMGDITGTGDWLTTGDITVDELILTNPTQDWKFTSRGAKALVLQSQGATDHTLFEFWQGGVLTDKVNQFRMYWNATPANQTNRETFLVGYDGSDCIELTTRLTSGTVRPIKIYHTGHANQINVAINGSVGFGVATPQEDVHAADTIRADTTFNIGGNDGASGSFTTVDGKTALVSGGIIYSLG